MFLLGGLLGRGIGRGMGRGMMGARAGGGGLLRNMVARRMQNRGGGGSMATGAAQPSRQQGGMGPQDPQQEQSPRAQMQPQSPAAPRPPETPSMTEQGGGLLLPDARTGEASYAQPPQPQQQQMQTTSTGQKNAPRITQNLIDNGNTESSVPAPERGMPVAPPPMVVNQSPSPFPVASPAGQQVGSVPQTQDIQLPQVLDMRPQRQISQPEDAFPLQNAVFQQSDLMDQGNRFPPPTMMAANFSFRRR